MSRLIVITIFVAIYAPKVSHSSSPPRFKSAVSKPTAAKQFDGDETDHHLRPTVDVESTAVTEGSAQSEPHAKRPRVEMPKAPQRLHDLDETGEDTTQQYSAQNMLRTPIESLVPSHKRLGIIIQPTQAVATMKTVIPVVEHYLPQDTCDPSEVVIETTPRQANVQGRPRVRPFISPPVFFPNIQPGNYPLWQFAIDKLAEGAWFVRWVDKEELIFEVLNTKEFVRAWQPFCVRWKEYKPSMPHQVVYAGFTSCKMSMISPLVYQMKKVPKIMDYLASKAAQ